MWNGCNIGFVRMQDQDFCRAMFEMLYAFVVLLDRGILMIIRGMWRRVLDSLDFYVKVRVLSLPPPPPGPPGGGGGVWGGGRRAGAGAHRSAQLPLEPGGWGGGASTASVARSMLLRLYKNEG